MVFERFRQRWNQSRSTQDFTPEATVVENDSQEHKKGTGCSPYVLAAAAVLGAAAIYHWREPIVDSVKGAYSSVSSWLSGDKNKDQSYEVELGQAGANCRVRVTSDYEGIVVSGKLPVQITWQGKDAQPTTLTASRFLISNDTIDQTVISSAMLTEGMYIKTQVESFQNGRMVGDVCLPSEGTLNVTAQDYLTSTIDAKLEPKLVQRNTDIANKRIIGDIQYLR